tara:strand:- start:481 stop:1347 length:867 start_codon:yes stop_codon:yes gene_type:complete
MIDRNELAQEIILRENIRKALKVIFRKRGARIMEEQKNKNNLRSIIRDLIIEAQSAVAAVAKHDSTGINALEDLLKNSNLLSVLETGYKSLTTRAKDDPEEGQTKQRLSYENHILSAVEKSLAPEESRKGAGEDVEITEEIDISVTDDPTDDPDFIDVEEKEEVEVDPREEFGINGEDKTGRNRAFTDFQDVEKVTLTAFDDLDNPEDSALFEEYLIKNLALYFEKWEGELQNRVEAPPEAGEAVADEEAPDEGELEVGADAETEVPEFELQEVIKHLDLDDIIANLL